MAAPFYRADPAFHAFTSLMPYHASTVEGNKIFDAIAPTASLPLDLLELCAVPNLEACEDTLFQCSPEVKEQGESVWSQRSMKGPV